MCDVCKIRGKVVKNLALFFCLLDGSCFFMDFDTFSKRVITF